MTAWTRTHWTLVALGVVASMACGATFEEPEPSVADEGSTTGEVGSTNSTASNTTASNTTAPNTTVSSGGSGQDSGGTGASSGAETSVDQDVSTPVTAGGGGSVFGVSGTFGVTGSGGCELFGNCPCEPVSSDVALDEVTPLGFSAEQVLALVAGPREATLVYDLNNVSGFELSLPDQATTVTLSIEPTGTAQFVTDAAVPASVACANVLEIDVEVTLSTADGAFNERFADKLVVDDPSRAHLFGPIDLESLEGNLSLGLPDGATISESNLNVILGDGFFAGDIAGAISACEGTSCGLGSVTFAAWNDSGCKDLLVPVTATDDAEPVVTGMLDLVNALAPLTITWGSGEASKLSLEASFLSPLLCHSPALAGRPGAYRLQTELSLSSEDGRLDTTLPVEIEGDVDAAGEPYVWFLNNYQNLIPVEVSSFEETYGLSDVEFGGALEAHLYFYLALGFSEPNSVDGGLDVRDGETVVEPIRISERE